MAPADFHVLRRLAQISHSAAHPLSQEPNYDANIIQATIELRRRLMDEELALSEVRQPPPTLSLYPIDLVLQKASLSH